MRTAHTSKGARLRVAVLHHWFVTEGGGERVAECLAALLPTADVFTLMHAPDGLPASLAGRSLRPSLLQRIPGATGRHRELLPLYPIAARSLDVRGYDLVVSSDSGPVKGARLRPGTPHLCYCHSPMRYLYDGFESYSRSMPWHKRMFFRMVAPYVRRADWRAAQRVTRFVANSRYVQGRIRANYGRESEVIYPPIDFHLARRNGAGDAYLAAGRMVAYKQTDLIVKACNRLQRQLRIVGTGPEEKRLRAMAGPTITFLGHLRREQLWQEYSRCRALLFAADEDFGMVPLEAESCGRPVIAYGAGGSLETVRGCEGDPNRTGLFFPAQTVDTLCEAILRFEAEETSFSPDTTQAFAQEFSAPRFLREMRAAILDMLPAADGVLASVDQALRTVA